MESQLPKPNERPHKLLQANLLRPGGVISILNDYITLLQFNTARLNTETNEYIGWVFPGQLCSNQMGNHVVISNSHF